MAWIFSNAREELQQSWGRLWPPADIWQPWGSVHTALPDLSAQRVAGVLAAPLEAVKVFEAQVMTDLCQKLRVQAIQHLDSANLLLKSLIASASPAAPVGVRVSR